MSNLKNVDANLDSVNLEKEVLKYWKDHNIFEELKENTKDKKRWVYYDGPITANNLPHYGHVITWTMKDAIPRYWTMKGYKVSRNIGWDCQGIPVEYEVEKKLEFTKKEDIEDYGVAKFNELCKQSVLEYRGAMFDYETRVGRWMDTSDQYATMDSTYIESIWWSLKELYQKGLLYEGHKVVAYSTRAGTTLSNAEVALGGYKEIVDPAITVKFKLLDAEDTYFLAWTTTPWTIPGNLLLAIGKNIEYVLVQTTGDSDKYVVAKDAITRVFGDKKVEIIEHFKAEELVNKEYKPIFDFFSDRKKQGAFKTVFGDHVSTEEGTGIVHLAPYGVEDFDILNDLGITVFDYLDEVASFNDLVPKYKGFFYKKANKYIIEDLKQFNALYNVQDYPHQMPMCWRTDTPLIYKPVKSWYLSVTKVKDTLLSENSKISWVPEHVKNGRFGRWLENAKDWAISRNRYWGTPIPVWINDKTGEVKVVGSFEELSKLSGLTLKTDFDPHRPFVDEITWEDSNGGTFRRIPDVLDVWFDSGSMPFAQYHYPFENKSVFEERFPADYISESVDQTRGWFYSLIVINVALFGKTPYKSVLMSGMLLGEDGNKLSKSKKNYPPMDEVLDTFGADILRYFLLSSTVVRGESARFSKAFLNEAKKEFFTTLWNSYRYFVTYAASYDFKPFLAFKPKDVLDKWILDRLDQTIERVDDLTSKNEVMFAVRTLPEFVNDLSTWYIRRSRDRISAGDYESLNTLYICLLELSKLMAPFVPFLSDAIYQNLRNLDSTLLSSVHLESYPKSTKKIDITLLENMNFVREVSSLGNSLRKENNLPVRQPLACLEIVSSSVQNLPVDFVSILEDELNVKKVNFVKDLSSSEGYKSISGKSISVALDTQITESLELEGHLRSVVREVQSMRKELNLQVTDEIILYLESTDFNKKLLDAYKKDLSEKVGAKNITLNAKTYIEKV